MRCDKWLGQALACTLCAWKSCAPFPLLHYFPTSNGGINALLLSVKENRTLLLLMYAKGSFIANQKHKLSGTVSEMETHQHLTFTAILHTALKYC